MDRWKLIIANAKGRPVTTFSGKGNPPREITWDGRGQSGALMTPGLTYSYVFEAFDRAGNKRNFVGEGFSVNAYRIDSTEGTTLVFSAAGVNVATATRGARSTVESNVSPLLLEVASALNESDRVSQPYKVTVTARTADQASQLAASITKALSTYVLGDPARFRPVTVVETDAPESGAVRDRPRPLRLHTTNVTSPHANGAASRPSPESAAPGGSGIDSPENPANDFPLPWADPS